MSVNSPLRPGIVALHSNQTESLAEALTAWLAQNPLGPLEEEVILVQSNAMAEWVKMGLAEQEGVCAATRVELPARFMWRTYRQVLGRQAVPSQSPLDKAPLTWRLMDLLPQLLRQADFSSLASFVQGDLTTRLYPLASRLADLFDQYQVYRPDWLADWAGGHDVLGHPVRGGLPVPREQLWQPQLWRALMAQLNEQEAGSGRPAIHQRVLKQLRSGASTAAPVARRVVAFGMTQLPQSILQLLAALAGHSQVLLAIHNPCRFHWGDIMDGRQLHQQIRRQSPLRRGQDLSLLPLDALHAYAHPLLAAWGRQGRDFVRQTDAFDDEQLARGQAAMQRIDLFEESTPADASLLQQVQAHIRDLVPVAEHPKVALDPQDTSIVFRVAHSLVRELEVLHDHLLGLLDPAGSDGHLQARDVVVMLPAVDVAAPAIRAVFGQYRAGDGRRIPFDIADLSTKAVSSLVVALEWVLRLPSERCTQSQLRDFLAQPSVAARFGLNLDALPKLMQWLNGAGVRWGLDADHRAALGLGHCGTVNTSLFGLHRMLMGYAAGLPQSLQGTDFAGIEPYPHIGGLDAELAGSFAHVVDKLLYWLTQTQEALPPNIWGQRFRELLATLFQAQHAEDRNSLVALEQALEAWLSACELAQFEQTVSLDVASSAWLSALDATGLERRFRAGGVTFCTMMPMRAIPFQVVCLLGMNEQDYPRRGHRSDFDLMGFPEQFRAGDRARHDDDRQLMLEALLSARRQLYISWSGRSVIDNSVQPPSVLVSQLRDYLSDAWGPDVVVERTREHPLQPFSRKYFEQGSALVTYAREWYAAHQVPDALVPSHGGDLSELVRETDAALIVSCDLLEQFLRNPVRAYFRHRLGVVFEAVGHADDDDERFELVGLDRFDAVRQLLDDCLAQLHSSTTDPEPLLQQALNRLQRAGQLPMSGMGRLTVVQLQQALLPLLRQWQSVLQELYATPQRQHLRFAQGLTVLEDWIGPLYQRRSGVDEAPNLEWVRLEPTRLTEPEKPAQIRVGRLLQSWLISLLASASGRPVSTRLMGLDATVVSYPPDPSVARIHLNVLLDLWREGQIEPLPLPFKTAWTAFQRPQDAAKVYDGDFNSDGEGQEPCLMRLFPDFESLQRDGRFERLLVRLMVPLQEWVSQSIVVIPHEAGHSTLAGEVA